LCLQILISFCATFFLILGWGHQPERVQAGIYLLFYTLLASLPLLVGILFIYKSLGSLCLFLLSGNNSLVDGLFYSCMVFAFLVRIPMFTYGFLSLMLRPLYLGLLFRLVFC
jgi:NADH-ubiquinone oxidoreductase chain 4